MNLPASVAEFLYRYRHAFVVAVLGGALFFAPQADLTKIDNDLSAWVSRDDPVFQTYERFRAEFGGTRSLIVAVRSDRIFTPEGLQFIEQITDEVEQIELVERVYSLATANIVRALPETAEEEGGIEVSPLLKGRTLSEADAQAVRQDALNEPLLRGDLVNADGTVTAVVITFDESRIDQGSGRIIDQGKGTGG